MTQFYGYIRVSTVRQTEGYSLDEQRSALEGFAQKKGIQLLEIFEEVETASKTGRKVFTELVKRVKARRDVGVLFHKIDRSVRNYQDWADIQKLAELNIPVKIVADDIDLASRSGRLTGDILAALASDYIRNLKQEIQKGQLGCLKQGLYPWMAPIGYLNPGSTSKPVDPVKGPLVREAFLLYATGKHSLVSLLDVMTKKGLTTRSGRPLTVSRLHSILTHPFYYGHIKIKDYSVMGTHEPLITKAEFDKVQAILRRGPLKKVKLKKTYLLRGVIHCRECSSTLRAEVQKGHVYYRCHSTSCKGTCIREDAVVQLIAEHVQAMRLDGRLLEDLTLMFEKSFEEVHGEVEEKRRMLTLRLEQVTARQDRLLDHFLDQVIDRGIYEERNAASANERFAIQAELAKLDAPSSTCTLARDKFVELLKALGNIGNVSENNEAPTFLSGAISNCTVRQKNVEITWGNAFQLLLQRGAVPNCAQDQNVCRTSDSAQRNKAMLQQVVKEVLRAGQAT